MSDEYRFGDETPPAERSQRLYQEEAEGAWYFRTREGTPMGPFETPDEAQQALDDFIEFIRLADLQTLSELTRSLASADEVAPGADGAGAAGSVPVQPDGGDPAVSANAERSPGAAGAATDSAANTASNTASNTVGAWDPDADATVPSVAVLRDLHGRFVANGAATALGLLSAPEVGQLAGLMRSDPARWAPLLTAFDSATLIALVRFFTLAEQQLPGWEAGRTSPAIACARELRGRHDYPAELTAWIRQHSDNRFLPYGSLLDRV